MCLYACFPVCAFLFGLLFPISLWSPERSSLWFWPLVTSGYIKLCTWLWYEPHVDSSTHTGIRESKLKCLDNKTDKSSDCDVMIQMTLCSIGDHFFPCCFCGIWNEEDTVLHWTGPGLQLKKVQWMMALIRQNVVCKWWYTDVSSFHKVHIYSTKWQFNMLEHYIMFQCFRHSILK